MTCKGQEVETSGYTTAGGIGVQRETREVDEAALEEIVTALSERRGGGFLINAIDFIRREATERILLLEGAGVVIALDGALDEGAQPREQQDGNGLAMSHGSSLARVVGFVSPRAW